MKRPPSTQLPLPRLEHASDTDNEHSEDSAGENEEAEIRTYYSRITRVGTKEAEGFDEDLDSPEYHDTIEESTNTMIL